MELKYFTLITLIFGTLIVCEVKSYTPKADGVPTARDLAEGWTYERFNFLNEFEIDGSDLDHEMHWKKCSNYTGIDTYLNKTGFEGCLGTVINCTSNINFSSYFHFREVPIFRSFLPDLYEDKCHCLCKRMYEPKPNSTESHLLDSFCLDTVSADIENNYVITGVRLQRLNNTLTFQIQQGKLEDGITDEENNWLPLPKKCNKIGRMNVSERTLVLDDIILGEDWFVTGVAFQRYDESDHKNSKEVSGNPFYLAVFGQTLESDSKLNVDRNQKFLNWDFTLVNRTNLVNDHEELPIVSTEPETIISESGKNYVTFELTAPDNGIREFVSPFIDIQQISERDPQPLRGIGIYYRASQDFGGYIAPKIFV